MNKLNEKFPGILLAYVNGTCYTLDNSDCNELSKFVQQIIDENAALKAELMALKGEHPASEPPDNDRRIMLEIELSLHSGWYNHTLKKYFRDDKYETVFPTAWKELS